MTNYYPASELPINDDGSVFHLHLLPEQLADKVVLVGDPGRVDLVASFFETRECCVQNREFRTITGYYAGKRISVISSGIGCDNIDIVLNELDALKNIDFRTRMGKEHNKSLEIVRIGTCGGLQAYTPIGSFICSVKSIGMDGLLNYYAGRNEVCDLAFEKAFAQHLDLPPIHCTPYVIDAHPEMVERIAQKDMIRGVTISCGGFFGPQGRVLRIPLDDPKRNAKIESFDYQGYKITNLEMESSGIAGLSRLLGHKATTVCMVIANRLSKNMNTSYHNSIEMLIEKVLQRI